jgi:hypothetical protein
MGLLPFLWSMSDLLLVDLHLVAVFSGVVVVTNIRNDAIETQFW